MTIVATTEKLLGSISLHDLSASAIIDAAGVSRPTFYFYYQSKYAVVTALLQRVFDEIEQSVEPWLTRSEDNSPEATLRSLLLMCARQWHQHAAVIRAAHENAHADPELGAIWFAILERFRIILSSEIQKVRATTDSVGGIDPEVLSSTLVWASERTLYFAARGDDPRLATPEVAAEGLLAIWLPAIYGIPYSQPGPGE
jgi:AcrR family transcriptional regulator